MIGSTKRVGDWIDTTGVVVDPVGQDEARSMFRSRLPTLWSRSYFAGSIGNVSAATIERYIAEQKGK